MATQHARETLEKKIKHLLDEVVILGSMVEQATLGAVKSLLERDLEASRRIYAADEAVNDKRFEIENECIAVIATQQPMATDLRVLAAILEIITELERMGDYAKGIAHINLIIGEEPFVVPLVQIPKMADIAIEMLNRAIAAFVEPDEETARAIPKEDDQVDALFFEVYRELMMAMSANPDKVDQGNTLLWAAHNLERTADRVTNICERTIFVVTGEMNEIGNSDDELLLAHKD
jgi:phosphate transport system protein